MNVDSSHTNCPLCGNIVLGNDGCQSVLSYCKVDIGSLKKEVRTLKYRWLLICIFILVLLNFYTKSNPNFAYKTEIFWFSFSIFFYLLIKEVFLPAFFSKRVIWRDCIKALMIMSVMLVFIDIQNSSLTWSIAFVLPILAGFCSVLCFAIVKLFEQELLNAIFFSIVLAVFNIFLFFANICLLFIFNWYKINLTIVFVSLCICLSVFLYFVLFEYSGLKDSTEAKLHV
ncbi:MAG: DUF6320 domain-containing protein [Clostridiales bacterium]|nr:DUF6320 domain-containing protein [Clostridiales bacterium]